MVKIQKFVLIFTSLALIDFSEDRSMIYAGKQAFSTNLRKLAECSW